MLALRQAGVEPVVASMGTALTEQQLKELGRLTHVLFLCFDADAAGEAATLRGMELAHAQGLDVRVVALPPGSDPADEAAGFERSAARRRAVPAVPRAADHQAGGRTGRPRSIRSRQFLAPFKDSPQRQDAQRLAADMLDLPRELQAGLAPYRRRSGTPDRVAQDAPGRRPARAHVPGGRACSTRRGRRPWARELGDEHFDTDEHRQPARVPRRRGRRRRRRRPRSTPSCGRRPRRRASTAEQARGPRARAQGALGRPRDRRARARDDVARRRAAPRRARTIPRRAARGGRGARLSEPSLAHSARAARRVSALVAAPRRSAQPAQASDATVRCTFSAGLVATIGSYQREPLAPRLVATIAAFAPTTPRHRSRPRMGARSRSTASGPPSARRPGRARVLQRGQRPARRGDEGRGARRPQLAGRRAAPARRRECARRAGWPRERPLSTPLQSDGPRRSPVAQLAEHPAVNRRVVGSSPTRGATKALLARGFSHPLTLLIRQLCTRIGTVACARVFSTHTGKCCRGRRWAND